MAKLYSVFGLLLFALALAMATNAGHGIAAEEKPAAPATKIAIGDPAPAFTLTGVDGKEVSLSDYAGKVVVLEWFNPDCPVVKGYYTKTTVMNDTAKKLADKGVVWLAINSGAEGKQGAGLERNMKALSEYSIQHPILMDYDGAVGRAYGAKTTPHVFVIDAKGKLAYQGAVTEKPFVDKPVEKNVLISAVTELLAGKPVTVPQTNPFGCSVKY
jgi:peroxiredoxin